MSRKAPKKAASAKAKATQQRTRAAASASGFEAASTGRRTRNWNASGAGINSLLQAALPLMRDRSRDQDRNNPWVRKANRSFVGAVIGAGITPIAKTPDEAFNAELTELWTDFCKEIDADGRLDFYGLQALCVRSLRTTGEILLRKIYRPTDQYDLLLPFQLQVIEADHLNNNRNEIAAHGGKIVQGVEFDATGKRIAYHVWKQHPQESLNLGNAVELRIPADEILHIFEPIRPGQVRGYPPGAASIIRMLGIDEYEDAELTKQKITAMLVGFLTSTLDSEDAMASLGVGDTTSALGGSGSADGVPSVTLESGTIQALQPGQDIKFNETAGVAGSFDTFLKWNIRAAAAGMDVSYFQMTGDLSDVNFSSARVGLNDLYPIWDQFQNNVVIHQICLPVWKEFVTWAVKTGKVSTPEDFAKNPRRYTRVSWEPPERPYIDPTNEANAIQSDLRNGLTSRARVVASRGIDINQLDKEIAADNARADSLELKFDSDPRKTTLHGQTQQTQQNQGQSNAEK